MRSENHGYHRGRLQPEEPGNLRQSEELGVELNRTNLYKYLEIFLLL